MVEHRDASACISRTRRTTDADSPMCTLYWWHIVDSDSDQWHVTKWHSWATYFYWKYIIQGSQKRKKLTPCERRDITDEALRVRNIFDANCLGLFIDGTNEGFRSLFCDSLGADPIMLECHFWRSIVFSITHRWEIAKPRLTPPQGMI